MPTPLRSFFRRRAVRVLLPVVAFLLPASATLVLWRMEREARDEQADAQAALVARRMARRIGMQVQYQFSPLRNLVSPARISYAGRDDGFADEARQQILTRYDFIAFVGPDGTCRLSVPEASDVPPGMDVGAVPTYAAIVEAMPAARSAILDDVSVGPDGDPSLLFAYPVQNPTPAGAKYDGFLLARLRLAPHLAALVDAEFGNVRFVLRDVDRVIYRRGEPPGPGDREPAVGRVSLGNNAWDLLVYPTEPATWRANTPLWVLLGGLTASALLAALVAQHLQFGARDHRQDQRHARALESLTEITAAVSGRLGSGQALLDHLAVAAGRLLGTEMAAVMLYEPEQRHFRLIAQAGYRNAPIGQLFPVDDVPMCHAALTGGAVVTVSDVRLENRAHNRDLMDFHRLRSVIMIPLNSPSGPIGLLTLGDVEPREFSDRDRRLAELVGSQFAVTLSNNRLYEQMGEALRAQQRLTQQREKLTAVTLALYQASSLDESLKRLVALAPSALDVDLCVVDMMTEGGDKLVTTAATQPFDSLLGTRYDLKGRNAERALRSREMLVIEDAPSDPSILEVFRRRIRIGSLIYAPLFEGNGRPLGVLVLVRHTPGPFSDDQLRLAQVFATRAAAAIEAARLYQQTRRDADTKAMLLRELNHRVKNNLAGIVGLLATRPPDLAFPAAAQRWLDRVIERISIMGRAHELFVGGAQTIELRELVDQLLPTLSVVKPAGVRVRKELGGVRVSLTTERAVALAMVLHELCYNAISHGLGEQGTLTIRGRNDGGEVVIEVADDGVGLVPVGAPAIDGADGPDGFAAGDGRENARRGGGGGGGAGSGWGLRLVEGLVARELRGRFSVRSDRLEGGTVATVAFPVTGEDT